MTYDGFGGGIARARTGWTLVVVNVLSFYTPSIADVALRFENNGNTTPALAFFSRCLLNRSTFESARKNAAILPIEHETLNRGANSSTLLKNWRTKPTGSTRAARLQSKADN